MSTASLRIDASAERVFDVLSDGWTYSNWVVGTSHIRAVDDAWPAVGSKLYHATGPWPLVTRDETVVEDMTPNRSLHLTARGAPLGVATIVINLEPDGDGCQVQLDEHPISPLARRLHNPVSDALLTRRNEETLLRLRATVERHTSAA
jgi:uncharacterized protein YndB with AHSA1/START domain